MATSPRSGPSGCVWIYVGKNRLGELTTCPACFLRIFIIWAISSWFRRGQAPQDQVGPGGAPRVASRNLFPKDTLMVTAGWEARHGRGECWGGWGVTRAVGRSLVTDGSVSVSRAEELWACLTTHETCHSGSNHKEKQILLVLWRSCLWGRGTSEGSLNCLDTILTGSLMYFTLKVRSGFRSCKGRSAG